MSFEQLESRAMMAAFDVLVFSKTAGFRHSSIDEGISAIQQLGAASDFTVTATEDANAFNDANLAQFEAVVFLLTTGDVLNATQEGALERYINAGGGWVGIHSAADTEYNWPFYGGLVGAYFNSHPAIQQATLKVADHVHPASAGLPERWVRTDEWYNYRANPRPNVHVLMTLDETTYSPGTGAMGFDHPISWVQEYAGGRSFYTGLGHTEASYSDANFRQHLRGGIMWAAGQVPGDAGATLDRNFQKVVLDDNTLNPMAMDIADDGRVFYVQRGGSVKMYNPQGGAVITIANIPVYSGSEDGLLGIALDPNFATNNWIYLFYSPPSPSEQHVSRFTLVGNQINMASERILLRIPVQRTNSNHSAGSMDFGADGNLYIALGDNTSPFASDGFAPIDERPGRSDWDAQKSSSNMNDLRGKILRIKPEDNGTYSIPAGNLFPANGSQGRPEIYVMGNRNPFRFSIDPETGWLYWGEVGPDAQNDEPSRGPRGYDEFNQARAAGNFGWPYFAGNNQAYREYDFATGISGPAYNPAAPVNNSPNNTGGQNLPPAQPAWIWYPYATSTIFPELGTGGRTAMGGPVYHHDRASPASTRKLPEYFDNTLFIYEWSRNWIKEVKIDAAGNVLKINDFLPTFTFRRPMDMKIGPDGAMYVIEWGSSFGGGNADSQLVRIDYLRESEWNVDMGGNWSDAANWSAATPNAAGANAVFGEVITAPRTVTVDVPISVGRIDFDNANAYTIAGDSSLTLNTTTGDAQINVTTGNHTISAPLTLADNTVVTISPAASSLTITDALTATGMNLTNEGAGTLTVNHVRAGVLTINAGSVIIAPNGGNAGTSAVDSLSINGTSKLDLNNNDLIVRSTAATKDAVHAAIQADIVSAQNGVDAGLITRWDGPGATSSTARTTNVAQGFDLTGLGVIRNSDLDITTGVPGSTYTTFSGQPVTPDDVLVKYTYIGDANLSGSVTFDDYVGMDNAFFGLIPNLGWATGDINFDNLINFDDYSKVDQAFFFQAAPLSAREPEAPAPGVAEPTPPAPGAISPFNSPPSALSLSAAPPPDVAHLPQFRIPNSALRIDVEPGAIAPPPSTVSHSPASSLADSRLSTSCKPTPRDLWDTALLEVLD